VTVDFFPISPLENDIIVVVYGWVSITDDAPSIVTPGYTVIAELYQSDVWDVNFLAAYKVMGSTPDGSVEVAGHGSNPTVAVAQLWRGASTSSPMDVAATTATNLNSSRPNSPSITPVTPGAVVLSLGVGVGAGGPLSTPSGMANGTRTRSNDGTKVAVAGIASADWVSGAYDPVAWGGSDGGGSDSWAAATIALRPA